MSPLPQRKKSADEIAKLRESFGIPGQEPGADPLAAERREGGSLVEKSPPQEIPTAKPQPVVEPISVLRETKEVRSLKRSERVVVLQPDGELPVEKLPSVPAPVELPVAADDSVHARKIVRSLRKSEQGPVHAPSVRVVPDSKLPAHRHSDEEINRIRRMEAIEAMAPHEKPRCLSAHPALVIPGYLLALSGAVGVYFYQIPLAVTASLAGTALVIALFIFIRKPMSRHHAAFIFIAVLFLTVFGALYYFPQIQHGT